MTEGKNWLGLLKQLQKFKQSFMLMAQNYTKQLSQIRANGTESGISFPTTAC